MALKRARTILEQTARLPSPGPGPSDAEGSSRFLRGVAIGALVGAAIAGSTVWQRRRVRDRIRRELLSDAEPGEG